ncbi:MAG: selenium-dependent xanthine dehydrogenase [SAR324 cluster bacterium]|nr:selenium-dependent xanthine dehydrogenase [SAR324 cluster bacterium]
MKFFLNGFDKAYEGDPELSLLYYLRKNEGLISPKNGCSPQGACGCCLVEMDGKGVLSCVTPMKKVAGRHITTTEGLDSFTQRVFTHAFAEKGAVQCGYCTPGFVMRAHVLLKKNSAPSREEVKKAINPNLCRCTGYKKIEEAILYAGEALREKKEIHIPPSSGKVGERHLRYTAAELVLGQRPFTADLKMEGALDGALKFSDHPRAKVISIHTESAEKHPGVVRVFTAKDVPGDRQTGIILPDWPLFIEEGEDTRYVGDVLAAVVAETEEAARQALELIQVDYEIKKPLTTPHEALLTDDVKIHPDGNLLSETVICRGNTKRAEKEAAFISRGTYKTQRIEHAFLEPECCLAQPWQEGIEFFTQGQGVYEDQKQIARLLGLPLEKIKGVLVPNGGAFGGKEDLSVQGHACLFAHLLRRPVRVLLTRDESIRMHPKRHPLEMEYTLGCDQAGMLTFLKARIIGDTGAYASVGMKVLERAAGHATGAYHVPNVDIQSRAVYTNNIPCGAMRGFGVNQVTFALESCLDDLCEQGNFDRWQIRYDNALTEGRSTATGQILEEGVGVRRALLAVKDHFEDAKYAGIACGIKNTGLGNGVPDEGYIKIVIESPTSVVLHHGWTEMGQGVNTMAVQFLCELTGISPEFVEVRVETSAQAFAGMTTGSRGTSILGHSIIHGAEKLQQDLENQPLKELVGNIYEGQWRCDWTTVPGAKVEKVVTHYSYAYAAQVVVLGEKGQVDTVYAAHDAGKIINPTLFEGQIEGSIHMGLGYALSENLILEDGIPQSTQLRKCGVLRAKQTPEIQVIGIEVHDPHGPLGAKGVGEIGLVPTAAAVANALYQYEGIRHYELPMGLKRQSKK